jgi:hypothetical protein
MPALKMFWARFQALQNTWFYFYTYFLIRLALFYFGWSAMALMLI